MVTLLPQEKARPRPKPPPTSVRPAGRAAMAAAARVPPLPPHLPQSLRHRRLSSLLALREPSPLRLKKRRGRRAPIAAPSAASSFGAPGASSFSTAPRSARRVACAELAFVAPTRHPSLIFCPRAIPTLHRPLTGAPPTRPCARRRARVAGEVLPARPPLAEARRLSSLDGRQNTAPPSLWARLES